MLIVSFQLFMIRKMLKDLYFFIFVLFVYMFGFMVVSEALMNPVRSDTFKVLLSKMISAFVYIEVSAGVRNC